MRIFWTLMVALGGLYGGFALLMYLLQSRLIHLPNIPTRTLQATPEDIGLAYESVAISTADGPQLHGWFIPAESSQGVLLFLHGNAGNISHRLDSLKIFHRLGLDVLIFDYRGYGQSEGKPTEAGLYQDAEAALRYLNQARGIATQEIIVFGRSLGGAVAAWLAAHYAPKALILESSFTSVQAMAAKLYPFLPTRWLTWLRYNTLENMQAVCVPTLVIHSRDDEIIPFAQGRQLYQAARGPKQFLAMRGDHNQGFLLTGQRYEQALSEFLAQLKEPLPTGACGNADSNA